MTKQPISFVLNTRLARLNATLDEAFRQRGQDIQDEMNRRYGRHLVAGDYESRVFPPTKEDSQ